MDTNSMLKRKHTDYVLDWQWRQPADCLQHRK